MTHSPTFSPVRDRAPPRATGNPKSRHPWRWIGGVLLVLAIAVGILVAIWDWNWFRGPLERLASARLHRQVTIVGDLNVKLWSWEPSATVDRIIIANPAWAGKDSFGSVGRVAVQIRILPLLRGDLDVRQLTVVRPNFSLLADKQGRKNWDFSDGQAPKPLSLPPIRNFVIQDGRLSYADAQRNIRFKGRINAQEKLGAQGRGFELVGEGDINRTPFRAEVIGGPLLNIERSKPYPFDVDIRAGETVITARGAVPKPFDFGAFYMAAAARGPDLADLFPLVGVALPNSPPYNLRGRLSRAGMLWTIDGLNGRVGDSDLSGKISVDTARKRPMLRADLRSNSLDFDDVGAIFGAAPKIGPGETASAKQVALSKQLVSQQRLLPDARLDVTRIRAMDADVTYRAMSIRDSPVKLTAASARVRLNDGVLRADPLRLELSRGRVEGSVVLDARKSVPRTDLDLRMRDARIEQLVPFEYKGAPALTGPLVARARLSGSGDSVRRAFGAANGEVLVVASGGEIRKAFAELMGVNVVKGLGLLSKTDSTSVNCAVAHFDTRNGVMTADRLVFDTKPVVVRGSGTINLDTERMSFEVRGKNKKFRVGHVLLPVSFRGPLMAPKLGVEPAQAVAQGGAAVALGAVLTPLAAILPFIDPGLAKDANCAGLLAEASQQGAPVRGALTARRGQPQSPPQR